MKNTWRTSSRYWLGRSQNYFSVLAQTFWVLSRKQSNLLPVSPYKNTVNSIRSDNHCTVFACNFDVLSRWIWKLKRRCHMKDAVNRGEKLIDNISCQTDRWGSFKEALTSNAQFWNPVQCSPQVKLVNLVWILTYIFKFSPMILIHIAKIWHKKSWCFLRYNWRMLPLFGMKFKKYPGKNGYWETFFFQVKGHGKTQKIVRCFGKHILAPIREAPNIGVHFHVQVQGFFRRKWRIWHILWQTIQNLF